MPTVSDATEVAELAYKAQAIVDDEALQAALLEVMPGRGNSGLDWEYFSSLELDMNDWGLVFGAAYAIARGENPYAPPRDIAELALAAAKVVYDQEHGGGSWRDRIKKDRDERGPVDGSVDDQQEVA